MNERIAQFTEKVTVHTTLAVSQKQIRTTKSGNPYLHLELADKTGKITARCWEETRSSISWESITTNNVYLFTGRIEEYQGDLQMNIEDIQTVKTFNTHDFLPSIDENIDDLKKECLSYLENIKNIHIKQLIQIFTDNDQIMNAFYEAPAAKSVHDAALGGLLKHTTRVMRLAKRLCSLYEELSVDEDLVIAGCFFHDFEKIAEYDWGGVSIEYSDAGHYIGHPTLAMIRVSHAIREIPDFPKEIEMKLLHMIASHAAEFDPIRLPAIPEALILHYADLTDSQLVHFHQEWKKNEGIGWKKDYLTNRWAYYPQYHVQKEEL